MHKVDQDVVVMYILVKIFYSNFNQCLINIGSQNPLKTLKTLITFIIV